MDNEELIKEINRNKERKIEIQKEIMANAIKDSNMNMSDLIKKYDYLFVAYENVITRTKCMHNLFKGG